MCLWVAEPNIIFEELGPIFGKHEARKEESDEGCIIVIQCLERWLDGRLDDAVEKLIRDDWIG